MNDETKGLVSERDAVKRERAAFLAGFETKGGYEDIHKHAANLYPLPKVERPRVVPDPISPRASWRVSMDSGCIEYQWGKDPWTKAMTYKECGDIVPLPDRVRLWADLLANPTEEVEADA